MPVMPVMPEIPVMSTRPPPFLRRSAAAVDLELPLARSGWRASLGHLLRVDGEAVQAFSLGFCLVMALAPGQADAQGVAASAAVAPGASAAASADITQALATSPTLLAARRQISAAQAGRAVLRETDTLWTAAPALTRRSAAGGAGGGTDWELVLARSLRPAARLAAAERVGESREAVARQAWTLAWRGEARRLLDLSAGALRQCQAAEAARELATSFEQQARGVARRAELGDAAPVEALQTRAALGQAEAQRELAQARCEAEAASLALNFPGLDLARLTQATGWSPTQPSAAITASSSQAVAGTTSPTSTSASSSAGATAEDAALVQAWLTSHPELAALRLERDRLQAEQGLALAELKPAPTVGLKVGQNAGGEKVLGLQMGLSFGGTALRRATEREQAARLGVAEAELAGLERRVQAQARATLQQRAAAERSAVDLARAAAQWQQSAAALAR
ncbi:MAG: hypothetical protein RL722_436, partial [Pseudomonadota bacterium]